MTSEIQVLEGWEKGQEKRMCFFGRGIVRVQNLITQVPQSAHGLPVDHLSTILDNAAHTVLNMEKRWQAR